MSNDTNDHIEESEVLLNEIFLRSSVETLLRAKYACKQWCIIVQNPTFIFNHFQYQKNHDKGRLFLQYNYERQHRYALFDDETLGKDTYKMIDHLQLREGFLYFEGPINGLYCLFSGKNRIALWNPTLMEYKTLPLPHPHFFPDCKFYECNMGFGTGKSSYDYKVVIIRKFPYRTHDNPDSYVTVYNLTTNTWRLLTTCNFLLREYISTSDCNSSFLDGSSHWWGRSGMVIAFNMAEEMFRLIMGPDVSHDFELICGLLTIYNDRVSLILRYDNFVDIWVMLEDGVWVKQFSVTSLPWFTSLVGLWKNNRFLFTIGNYGTNNTDTSCQIVLYDSNTQKMRLLGPKGSPMFFQASIYYESLVSLTSEHKGNRASLDTISAFINGS